MNKRQSQSGSGHLVVVFILVIALIGALGYVVYDRFVDKPIGDTEKKIMPATKEVVSSEVALSEIAYDKTAESGLAIKYPKSWAMVNAATDSAGGTKADNTTITSPDGTVAVKFNVSLVTGYGGTCVAAIDGSKPTQLVQLSSDAIIGYPGARYIAYIDHNTTTGTYSYFVGAQEISDYALSVKVGDLTESCHTFGRIGYELPVFVDKKVNTIYSPLVSVSVEIRDVNADNNASLSEINSAMETDNFKIAKRIVQSLYVKE